MKKKLLSVILSVGLALCFPITAMAETVSGGDNWNVKFTPEEKMEMVTDYPALIDTLRRGDLPVFFLPNYTAMMEIRPLLQQAAGGKDFWE